MSNGTDRVPEYFVYGMNYAGNYTYKLFLAANIVNGGDSLDFDDLDIVTDAITLIVVNTLTLFSSK